MARPTLNTAPTAQELAVVDCPVERYVTITRLARTLGTLPKPIADLRKEALTEALGAGHTAAQIAGRADQSEGRVSQLLKLIRTASPRLAAGTES